MEVTRYILKVCSLECAFYSQSEFYPDRVAISVVLNILPPNVPGKITPLQYMVEDGSHHLKNNTPYSILITPPINNKICISLNIYIIRKQLLLQLNL